MESDGSRMEKGKSRNHKYTFKLLIIIMVLLANNPIIKCYANALDSDEKYELAASMNVFNEIKRAIVNTLNIKVEGYSIGIEDNTYGYVKTEEERKEILNKICNKYIEELNINPKNITRIGVSGNLEAIPEKVKLSELSESNEIASEIYEACVTDRDLLGLTIEVNTCHTEEFEPNVVFEEDSSLYIGESERIDGVNGKKKVYKEQIFDGLTKVEENIVKEEVVVEATPTVIKTGTKNPYYDGIAFLARPTRGGYMSSEYGEQRGESYHKGIDIAKDMGENVYSALDGKVISAGYNDGGYGNLIIVDHGNNIKTYYAHLSEIYVNVGDYISKGKVIGAIGSTGYSTGPHLHFELRIDDMPVDPTNYILDQN